MEVGIACDAKARFVEICAKGGKKVRDEYVISFAKHFAPQSETPVETPRRNVMLDTLKSPQSFSTEPSDGIERIEVSSLDLFSTGGGFIRVDKRGEDETIYQFLDRRFGPASPLRSGGWNMTGATIRIIMSANESQRRHTLTVTLRPPNTTTLPNKTERDRQFVFDLLERWNLLAPPPKDDDAFEVLD